MVHFDERSGALVEARRLKMARSAHAYVRGSTTRFYEWLQSSGGKVPEGPPVWICGDCHVGNLGPLADARGRVAVQIRDLDQTVVGNPAHDLIRLGLSLASAARGSDLPGVVTAHLLDHLAAGYEAALAGRFHGRGDRSHRPKRIQALLERSVNRRWRHLAAERLNRVKPELPLGRTFWVLAPEERAGLEALFAQPSIGQTIAGVWRGDAGAPVEVIDAAYWMKGCSSLGRLRYAVMLRVGTEKAGGFCLIDVKEAVGAAAPRAADRPMPRDNAQRVVAGARALSPNLGERMIATRLLGKAVVLRELAPQDLKLEIDRLEPEEGAALAAYLGGVVGRAHGRQMTGDVRRAWGADLAGARTRAEHAPHWLWSNTVELLALHEAAYLDHCRRFAMPRAA